MQYEHHAVRAFELVGDLFPPPKADKFDTGQLSMLYAALNQDDVFDSCATRGQHAATFEGEHLMFEIDGGEISIDARSYLDVGELKARFAHLLDETLKVLGGHHLFFVKSIRLTAFVPEGKNKDVGSIIRTKATKLKPDHLANLPGEIGGAALMIAGHAGEDLGFGYKVTVAPYLSMPDTLYLDADLDFDFPDPDEIGKGTDLVQEDMQKAYDFATKNLVAFAQSFLP